MVTEEHKQQLDRDGYRSGSLQQPAAIESVFDDFTGLRTRSWWAPWRRCSMDR